MATCLSLLGFAVLLFALNPIESIYRVASLVGIPAKLEPLLATSSPLQIHDDYYAVEYLDPQTIAISEPRYWQKNVNYLLLGERQALLFDSGPGVRDIIPLVRQLTKLPIIVTASHLHYDHVSAFGRIGDTALIDLPHLKHQVDANGLFVVDKKQYLGAFENLALNPFKVNIWLNPDSDIDLGGRTVRVLATPGHTEDSMMLFDVERRQLFAGDFIYPGYLVAILPGANMGQYLATATRLVTILPKNVTVFPGHGKIDSRSWKTPHLMYQDLADLKSILVKIREGVAPSEALFPRQFRLNPEIAILTPFSWNMSWEAQ